VDGACAGRVGGHGAVPAAGDRGTSPAELQLGGWRLPRHGGDVHAGGDGHGDAAAGRAVGLPSGPEAEPRRRALRLETDGRKTRGPAREDDMRKWSRWIRQTHRWLSLIFTATVIANFVALGTGD